MKRDNWYDKEVYAIPMTSLNFYNHDGSCPTSDGIDSFEYNGETFRCDDMVVVDGEIGNIECVNLEAGYCGLGLSFDYADTMAGREWTMTSGYRCKLDGIRHATDEEIKKYEIPANECCDIAEASDRAWKERFEKYRV